MNIQLYFLRVRNACRHVYRFFERRWKRNTLWTFLLATFFVLGMWVSAAWASEAPSVRVSDSEPTQVLSATSRIQRDRSDWVSSTTTTSTTTTSIPTRQEKRQENTPKLTAPVTASQSEIEAFIREQAPLHGLDVERMVRIGRCESGFITNNINYSYYAGGGHPTGVYQYLPETWSRISGRSGLGGDVFDGKQNVLVTMWAFQNGYSGEWACK